MCTSFLETQTTSPWYHSHILPSIYSPLSSNHLQLSKFLGWLLGLLGLIAIRCTSCLHAGAYSDLPEEGVTITFHLTSFFYIRSWETQQASGLKS